MKGNNPARDLSKNVGGTTPVTYRNSAAVYRSLSAVPAQLEVERHQPRLEKQQFSGLVGPQSKSQGEVVWAEQAKAKPVVSKESHPLPIPLIVANAPHTTLYLESNPVSKVVAAVNDLFQQHQVDVEFNQAKFKWKCACYDSQVETRFVSRLFSVPDKANYFVLDFQRRSGDPFHFQSVYKAINFKLLKSGFVVHCGENKNMVEPVMRTFKPMALPANFFAEDDCEMEEEKDAKEYEPLCKMCTSPYIDVQREGLSALANHLEQSEAARRCLAPYAERLIEAVSLSRDMQVRRLAAAALAALSSEAAAHRFVMEKGGLRVLANLVFDEAELLETRRQAGKALLNIHELDSDVKSIIKRAPIVTDARLVQIVKDLKVKALA